MSKLFSHFSSFGPELASLSEITSSTHSQSIDSGNASGLGSGLCSGQVSSRGETNPSSQNQTPKVGERNPATRLRKISIHLVNEIIKMEKLHQNIQGSATPTASSTIKVYCRFKPATTTASPSFKYDESMVDDGSSLYSFDGILSEKSSQEEVYDRIARPHIEELLNGNNTTIFAYGQTSSGKTHTMFGKLDRLDGYGIIPRSLKHIFEFIKESADQHHITCSMLEIYRQKLKDLFAYEKKQLKIKENSDETFVEGLMEISVQNEEELANIINLGHGLRRVAHTYHNDYSSRSHTMLFLHNRRVDRDGNVQRSKLCLVDLAGSEKVSKTGATGDTLEEAKKINLSLSCLGNVIHSLTSGADHIPYRDSKLTRILKDSLCGHHKTSIITTCSLNKEDRTETISTMKFAIRAKRIKNKQHLSILPKDNNGSQESLIEVIEKLRKQLEDTKKELDKYRKLQHSQQLQVHEDDDVPEEMAESQPLKSIQCNFHKARGTTKYE